MSGRNRGRSNARSRAKKKSQAHQGRDLQIKKSNLVEKRLSEWPDESFCDGKGFVHCQACNKYIQPESATIKRHLGKDPKQRANSNSGKQHVENLRAWIQRRSACFDDDDEPEIDYANIRHHFLSSSLLNGLNASQTAGFATDFFKRVAVPNSSNVPKHRQGVLSAYKQQYEMALHSIKHSIDKNESYSLVIDESPDRWDDYSVTVLLYNADPKQPSKTLDIVFREVAADAEGVQETLFDASKTFELERDRCSSINVDSAKYNETAIRNLKIYFRLSVPIFDMVHVIANGLKESFNKVEEFNAVKSWFEKSHSVFVHAQNRKFRYKRYLAAQCEDVNDDGDLKRVLDSISPAEQEAMLEEPIRRNFDDEKQELEYKVSVLKALSKRVSYNTYPPKLIEAKFKSSSYCALYHIHRFFNFKQFIEKEKDVPADHICKQYEQERAARSLYMKILWSQSYTQRAISTLLWFEGRKIAAHKAYDKLQDLLSYYRAAITFVSMGDAVNRLFTLWSWSNNAKSTFKRECTAFKTFIYEYYDEHMHDQHPTIAFFKSCRYFNIYGTAVKPERVDKATTNIPWGSKYYSSNVEKTRQLQRECDSYRNEIIAPLPGGANEEDASERVLEFWRGKLTAWPLLSKVAIRVLMVVVSTADVERIFSVYNYYLGQLDTASLGAEHKRCKAFILQNKKWLK